MLDGACLFTRKAHFGLLVRSKKRWSVKDLRICKELIKMGVSFCLESGNPHHLGKDKLAHLRFKFCAPTQCHGGGRSSNLIPAPQGLKVPSAERVANRQNLDKKRATRVRVRAFYGAWMSTNSIFISCQHIHFSGPYRQVTLNFVCIRVTRSSLHMHGRARM